MSNKVVRGPLQGVSVEMGLEDLVTQAQQIAQKIQDIADSISS